MPITPSVSRLSDHQLLASAKELAHRERHLNLRIIEHLREIGSRGLHLRHGYGSLFDYAVKELGFGEGSAYQRLQALKLSDEFPEVKQDLEEGELTLTAAGYLQSAFDRDARRQRQWTREQRRGAAAGESGVGGTPAASGAGIAAGALQSGAAGETQAAGPGTTPLSAAAKRELIERARGKSTRQVRELIAEFDPELVRPRDRLRALGKGRWEFKATIDSECRQGLEQLRHWLSHVNPAMDYGVLLQRLVADAVAKYDPVRRPERAGRASAVGAAGRPEYTPANGEHAEVAATPARRAAAAAKHLAEVEPGTTCAARGGAMDIAAVTEVCVAGVGPRPSDRLPGIPEDSTPATGAVPCGLEGALPFAQKRHDRAASASRSAGRRRVGAARTRAIAAAVRRHVWLRDRGRCTYRDPETGRCCGSRHLVQIDHIQPYAMGGPSSAENLRLLCAAHNRARLAKQSDRRIEG